MLEIDLTNKSNISTDRLIKILKFARPRGCHLCKFIVKNTKVLPFSAEFYYGIQEKYCICRFGPSSFFPYNCPSNKTQSRNGYNLSNYHFESKTSAILYIFCHEAKHIETLQNPKTRHLMYSTGPEKEILADEYAIKILNKYRKLKEEGFDPFK